MEVRISNASSLFKENGHDLKGICNLLFNAVLTEICSYGQISAVTAEIEEGLIPQYAEYCEKTKETLADAIEHFEVKLEKAEELISRFDKDYQELKAIDKKIEETGFWKLLFKDFRKFKTCYRRKRELCAKQVSLNALLNVAFFKFSQKNGTKQQFVDGVKRFLASK